MKKGTLTIMVGIPASGKSFFARHYSEATGAVWVSRDKVRDELFPDPDYSPRQEYDVRAEYYRRLIEALDKGKDCIADSTNLTPKHREALVTKVGPHAKNIVAVCLDVGCKVAIPRNRVRTGKERVPDKVIRSMYRDMKFPTPHELKGGQVWIITPGPDGETRLL